MKNIPVRDHVECGCGSLSGIAEVKFRDARREQRFRYIKNQFHLHYQVTGEFFVEERGKIRCAKCGELALIREGEKIDNAQTVTHSTILECG